MYIGGYQIIDFLNEVINTTGVTIAGIYDKLEAAFGTPKAIMITGVNVANVSTPAAQFVSPYIDGTDFVIIVKETYDVATVEEVETTTITAYAIVIDDDDKVKLVTFTK